MAKSNDDRNFYFDEDGIAYTEDGVVVHNIFMYKVSHDVTEKDVRTHFREFGEVTKVILLPQVASGFVQFSDPLAAGRALEKRKHTLSARGKRCNVDAPLSSSQPSAAVGAPAETSENVATTLVHLNDDCLLEIFGYLKGIDQIHFAMAHSRLLAVFEFHPNKEFTMVDMRKPYRQHDFRNEILLTTQDEKISYYNRERKNLNFECNWGTNVKSVNRYSYRMRIPFMLLQMMQQITNLKLVNLYLKDEAVREIRKMPNLRTLSLEGNNELTGRYLDRLTTVHELNLSNCAGLEAPFVRNALIALTQLTSLNLYLCILDLRAVFDHIPGGCSKLKVLETPLQNVDAFGCVAQLSSLKHLTLSCERLLEPVRFNQHLEQLSKAEHLEYLDFSGFRIFQTDAVLLAQFKVLRRLHLRHAYLLDDACLREFAKLKLLEELDVSRNDHITDEGVEHVLRVCPKLTNLNLGECTRITEALLHRAIDALNETQAERNALVEIDVTRTAIRKSTVEADAAYRAASARNLLKMHCESQRPIYMADDSSDSD